MLGKTVLFVGLISAAGSAFAADLPVAQRNYLPTMAAAPFTWTGFYAGLNAGAAFDRQSRSLTSAGFVPGALPNPIIYDGGSAGRDAGFTGGLQAGYNMQFGQFVAGIEADINYIGRSRGANGVFPAPVDRGGGFDNQTDFTLSRTNGGSWFGTARGRLGYAFDRALIYATGGLAFSGKRGISVQQRDYFENCTPIGGACPANGTFGVDPIRNLASSGNKSNFGWALGAGGEYAITNNISLKLEYLHVDFGRTSQTFTSLASVTTATMQAGNTITVRNNNKFDLVRTGLNFRF